MKPTKGRPHAYAKALVRAGGKPWSNEFPIDRGLDDQARKLLLDNLRAGISKCTCGTGVRCARHPNGIGSERGDGGED
jgi:hypothetical protein